METAPLVMEGLIVICQSSFTNEVIKLLGEAGGEHFTVLHGALGVGETGRHEGSPVWPGQNSLILCCVCSECVPAIVEKLKTLHDSHPNHSLGLKVFATPVKVLL